MWGGGEERRITSVSLRCEEVYFSVTNDHVLKVLNFSCLSQKIVSRTLIKRLTAILTPFFESTQFFLLVRKNYF